MPRTKETRNFRGSILKRKAVKNGKKATAYDARVRVPRRSDAGEVLRDESGRVLYKDITARCWTPTDANIALLNLINEAENGHSIGHERVRTFGDLADYYTAEYVKPAVIVNGEHLSGFKSNISYKKTIIAELERLVGARTPLTDITFQDLRKVKEQIAQTPTQKGTLPAVSTVNEKMSILRRMFNVAIDKDWLQKSPFKKGEHRGKRKLIDRSAENRRSRQLTFDEEQRLFAVLQPHEVTYTYERKSRKTGVVRSVTSRSWVDRRHLIPIITIALDTALRVGEVFNLEPWQIDFDRNVIYLTHAAAAETKTGEPGIMPMTARVRAVLEEARDLSSWDPEQKIFRRFEYKRSFNSACAEAGIENLQLRDSRSTGATRMVLAGTPESQVMKTTRHKNLKIFLDHYTNVDIENARQIGRNLDDYIEKQSHKGELEVKRRAA
jgi:integrase